MILSGFINCLAALAMDLQKLQHVFRDGFQNIAKRKNL